MKSVCLWNTHTEGEWIKDRHIDTTLAYKCESFLQQQSFGHSSKKYTFYLHYSKICLKILGYCFNVHKNNCFGNKNGEEKIIERKEIKRNEKNWQKHRRDWDWSWVWDLLIKFIKRALNANTTPNIVSKVIEVGQIFSIIPYHAHCDWEFPLWCRNSFHQK